MEIQVTLAGLTLVHIFLSVALAVALALRVSGLSLAQKAGKTSSIDLVVA